MQVKGNEEAKCESFLKLNDSFIISYDFMLTNLEIVNIILSPFAETFALKLCIQGKYLGSLQICFNSYN